jgi:hypothetical protein
MTFNIILNSIFFYNKAGKGKKARRATKALCGQPEMLAADNDL